MEETLIRYGGALKSLGGRRIGGYLCIWGDENATDLEGEFFTKTTDFDFEDGEKRSGYYNHGLDLTVKNRKIGRGSLKTDDVGVWLEAQIAERDEYCDAVLELAEKGALGLSSGALNHLVRKEPVKNADGEIIAHRITHWPIGEWSATPTPAEPRTKAVALKSLAGAPSLAELTGKSAPATKGLLGDYLPQQMTMAALRTLNDALVYSFVWDALYSEYGQYADLTLPERLTLCRQAFDEFRDIALRTIEALLQDPEQAPAVKTALKSLWGEGAPAAVPESLAAHTQAVVQAVTHYTERLEGRAEARKSAGRQLSAANVDDLSRVVSALEDLEAVKSRLAGIAPAPAPSAPVVSAEAKSLFVVTAPDLDSLRRKGRAALLLAGAA